ncbi:MAG: peptidase M10 [Bacteroidetes bacterium]|nr:MAG: peptidase M10 [Bacteroidota bacterium]
MGEVEFNQAAGKLIIRSVFYFYGDAASTELSDEIAADIAEHWNEPKARIVFRKDWFDVIFDIEGIYFPDILPETIWYNTNPRFNYFRIEEHSFNHISFVDGINCNTGYFKLDNLLNHSTTAAHEYGHTLGLDHPQFLDIRGKGQPGIMYPRGTVCDPAYQYDPAALPLQPGGTLNPYLRKVMQSDIDNLRLHKLSMNKNGTTVLGDFSSQYHDKFQPGN